MHFPRICRSSRKGRFIPHLALLTLLTVTLTLAATPAQAEDARLLRFPDIHEDFVVFIYGGDLWRAPSSGGEARRLTSHPGQELFPQISPDGQWIAFSAEYSGSRQVYVMPSDGGAPKQLTFYTDVGEMPPRGGFDYWVLGWSPDGKILVRMNRTPWGERMGRYFLVDPAGGLETPLPIHHGGGASLSADGKRLAYTPIDREFRTWKRTLGGRAQDIWIFDLESLTSKRLTDDRGTDNFPMWSGDTVYFTSDRNNTLNLFAYDAGATEPRQVTQFETWDVLWPSIGGDQIVFMNGGYLYRLDVNSGDPTRIPITIHASLPYTVPSFIDVRDDIQGASLSPSGARAVIEARGELFTVPKKHGPIRRLTHTEGTRERDPAWSPDGQWIAYFSDATGEYELYVRPQDGSGEARQLTDDGTIWRSNPLWSPDSTKIAFGDRARRLWIADVASGELTEIDRGVNGDLDTYSWSPDSRYLAYHKTQPSGIPGIMVYSLQTNERITLSDGMTNDTEPVFSADGQSILFLSDRDYQLTFSSFEFDYVYNNSTRVYIATLSPSTPHPFPPRSDEETAAPAKDNSAAATANAADTARKAKGKKGKKAKEDSGTSDDASASSKPPQTPDIVAAGFNGRTLALPDIEPANYFNLNVTKGGVFYQKLGADGPPALFRYNLAERREERLITGVGSFDVNPDGSAILYDAAGGLGIAAPAPGLDPTSGHLDLSALRLKIDPRQEWQQMYRDGWRIGRDWFYDPNMHGYDWKALGDRYGELVSHVAHRSELDFIFGELIGELEAGHTYVAAGDEPQVERVEGGMLGCELEFDRDAGAYRIQHIFPGENWHERFRSPLTEPGVDVQVGDYLLAIDGLSLSADVNPYQPLEGKANQPVKLLVNDKPTADGAREVLVRPVSSELDLRYHDWVTSRMQLVDRLSGGRIGYIHLPDTATEGNRMLQKLFYSQVNKDALIIDDRYNAGGFIPDRLVSYFERTTRSYWGRRDVDSMKTPAFAHDGPKAMLVNGFSSSGGDALPYYFRQSGLGKLIGTRTWGGLIGISGAPPLLDGGVFLPPTFRIYDPEGQWVVENEGVEPDIEVFDLPESLMNGGDPSIEKAVEVLLEELEGRTTGHIPSPIPPDLSN